MSSPASVTVTISLYSFTFLTSSHVCVYDLVGKQPQAVVAQGTAGLLELPARRRLQGLLLGLGHDSSSIASPDGRTALTSGKGEQVND